MAATSRATSSGWIERCAYRVRDVFSRSAAEFHSASRVSCRGPRSSSSGAEQRALLRSPPALQQPLDDRVRHLGGRGLGDRHRDAEVLPDLAVLLDQHLQDLAVDAVVLAVHGDDPDDVALLAVAVDAALALVVARRVPRQVVVDDGVEVVLEVDALGQAVGGDQDPARGRVLPGELGQLLDPRQALLGRERAGDGPDHGLAAQLAVELLGEVLGGRDVAAEDDRVVAVGRAAP